LADKILTTTAIVYMTIAGVCHPVVLVIILTREFAVSGVRMVAAAAGGKVIAANIWGKVKTALQMVTIVVYYLFAGLQEAGILFQNSQLPQTATNILMWIIAAVTAISGWQYIWANRKFINTAK
ncbi:MAG: CDP-alcohol phosphatidyltransferase family protein, partial [Oscillospiraceae bacterium]